MVAGMARMLTWFDGLSALAAFVIVPCLAPILLYRIWRYGGDDRYKMLHGLFLPFVMGPVKILLWPVLEVMYGLYHATQTYDRCPICQDPITFRVRKLKCGHCFHYGCVDGWFAIAPTCPICRVDCNQQNTRWLNALFD